MTAQTRTSPGSACGGDEHGLVHSPAADTPATADAPSEVSYERVDPDRYVVLHDGPVGFVEVVPPVFVCYVGHPYAQASEIAQVHDFHRAVEIVAETAASPRAPKITA
ncbi:hypothetical protein KZC52_07370 [Microbacterium sp. kSW2-24]|uniref:hypothetical protein n=1 Tax=Microbacterium TaxID=33882 RepID=UPI001FFD4639|nr:hypothetical protein [Microbacterium galbinum]MCK2022737.1 hypothetical protein [Microbacterium galbinum]